MATEIKSNVVKPKPSGGNQAGPSSISSSKGKVDSSVTKKKAVDISSSKQSADAKQKFVSTAVSKTEVKAKATSSSSKTVTSSSSKTVASSSSKTAASSSSKTATKNVTKTRAKKVYSLPGQKYDVPEEREPLRIFYESLSKQIPSSEMAEFWMMEHGLLSPERAKRACEKKQRKQKQLRTGTPIKSPPPRSKPESSMKPQQGLKNGEVKPKKRIRDDSDDDEDDFVLSHKRRKG